MHHRKKLIEVTLPLDIINDASAYDKMPGIGPHPKGIHHWWARLPLPAARAVLFASLVDDPSSNPDFANSSESEQEKERDRLFGVMSELLQKKIHTHPEAFKQARREIHRSCEGRRPSVLDPFCGHGAIPFEAQRLGLEAQAQDLNPVAVLISKALVEILPRFAEKPPVSPQGQMSSNWQGTAGLAEDVRYYGQRMRKEAEKRIGHLYPKVRLPKEYGGGGATVIAWLWARTVRCPNPACLAQMPLVRSFVVSKKRGKQIWVQPIVKNDGDVRFEVKTGEGKPRDGTINRNGATCLYCNTPVPLKHVRSEGKAGRMYRKLMAIVADSDRGRIYISPEKKHEELADKAEPEWKPEGELQGKCKVNVPLYGLRTFGDLFTLRQLVALNTFAVLVKKIRHQVRDDAVRSGMTDDEKRLVHGGQGADAYADAVATFLAFTVDRCSDFNNALCRWVPTNEKVMGLFARQAIPMVWDYAEANILAEVVGGWPSCNEYIARCIEVAVIQGLGLKPAEAEQLDASNIDHSLKGLLVSTDPPYYDNIGYADLSDFFYVWLRRSLSEVYPNLFSTILVPKDSELTASPYRFHGDKKKAKEHFEEGFKGVFSVLKGRIDPRYPMTVYYAFKQDEKTEVIQEGKLSRITLTTGWETLLSALVLTGYQITATWPVRASQKWRLLSMGTNALASYVVLALRPRSSDASLTTRRDFISALQKELPSAFRRLQRGNIAPVDLAQASIGPGMAIFSRYSMVLNADGTSMTVRAALGLINQVLDEFLAEQEAEFDGDTRWALAWFEQYGMQEGPYGVAETLSKAKNTAIQGLATAGIISSRAGKVRVLRRDELRVDWDPTTDKRLTVWEVTHHLIRRLMDKGSEEAAADLLRKVGALGEVARDLAYRLYTICERKKWAQEALAYNSLVVAWPDLVKLAGQRESGIPYQEPLL